jgi:hypothetical protein
MRSAQAHEFLQRKQRVERANLTKAGDRTRAAVALLRLAGDTCAAQPRDQPISEDAFVPLTDSISQPLFLVLLGLGSTHHDGSQTLQISGRAAPRAEPAAFYAFTPTIAGHSGRPLTFTIKNKPAWASFGIRHGTIYGTPQMADAGMYSNILITVSDGITTTTLPAFSIAVAAVTAAGGH